MKKFAVIVFGVVCFSKVFTQEAFMNFNQSLIAINPSFAGSNGGMRFQGSYSSTYFYGPNVPFTCAADVFVPKIKSGLAVSWGGGLWQGIAKSSRTAVSYAYHFATDENKIKVIPSIQVGFGTSELSEFYSPTIHATRYLDFGAGILTQLGSRLIIGCSLNNVNRSILTEDEDYLLVRPSGHFHASYTIKRSSATVVQVYYRLGFQENRTINQLGVDLVLYKHLVAGAGMAVTKQEYHFNDGSRYRETFDRPYGNMGYRGEKFSASLQFQPLIVRKQGYSTSLIELHFSVNLSKPEPEGILATFENF